MKKIELVRLDPKIDETLAKDPAYIEAMVEGDWSKVAALVQQLLGRTVPDTPVSDDILEWGGYYVVDADTLDIVGSCGFKGEPSEDGTVEIAYFTYPGFEGRGYATEMARKLLKLAADCMMIKQVIAHTLPEANASTRVLEKVAMNFGGEVIDPDDGRVWRWETLI